MSTEKKIPTPQDILARTARPSISLEASQAYIHKRIEVYTDKAGPGDLPLRVPIPADKFHPGAMAALVGVYAKEGWAILIKTDDGGGATIILSQEA